MSKSGAMQGFMAWMEKAVAPAMRSIANNAWISGLQKSILKTLPLVLVGSLITIYNVIRNFIPALPVLAPISQHTFGLISICMVFLVPYFILEAKNNHKMKFVAGFTGIGLFFMMVSPEVTPYGHLFAFQNFGAGGMFVAIVAGLFTAFVMNLFRKLTFFKEDSVMPDFVREWFDSMIPIFVVIFIGWLLVFQLNVNLYDGIVAAFSPLIGIAQSPVGMVLLYLIPTIFYSVGISGWVFQPILAPIFLTAITANADAVAAGLSAEFIFTAETTTAFLSLGGRGVTIMLVFLMFFSRSRRLKALGRASTVPTLLNINEPVVFGAVAWNPILMLPMWINSIVVPVITYIALSTGLVGIPAEVFALWYTPVFLSSWLVTGSITGLILVAINLAVSLAIWFPFYKLYEAQEVEKEQAKLKAAEEIAQPS